MKVGAVGLVMATWVLALCAGAAAASRPLVPLISRARIYKSSVTLADLLPPSAPVSLRAKAALIPLGSAPLPGNRRRISRSEIENRLGTQLIRELAIPQSVVVERTARELPREEVFKTIREALARGGFAGANRLVPEDVHMGMPVMVTGDDTRLRVQAMKFDPTLHQAVFRLWIAQDANVEPFDVMVQPVAGLENWLARQTGDATPNHLISRARKTAKRDGEAEAAWQQRKPQGKPLVMPWQPASLLLISKTMEIHTTAEPLERGYLSQVIRVRMPATKQIFRAEVVAPGCLEAQF